MRYKRIIPIAVLIALVTMLLFWLRPEPAVAPTLNEVKKENPIRTAGYICNNKKTIDVAFYKNGLATTTPAGRAELILSDNRTLILSQTLSTDGARYANDEETFIFWAKGNGALVTDNGDEKSYWGCIAAVPPTPELPNVYHDGQNEFTIRYVEDWKIDSAYRLLGPDTPTVTGVKFTIPPRVATGTNLSAFDTGISVEIASTSIENAPCSAETFTFQTVTATTTIISGREYLYATTSDAGAGNFYEEQIFVIPNSQPCTAVRYFIHSTNIDNYEPGTIKSYDRTSLIQQFESILNTLVIQ